MCMCERESEKHYVIASACCEWRSNLCCVCVCVYLCVYMWSIVCVCVCVCLCACVGLHVFVYLHIIFTYRCKRVTSL